MVVAITPELLGVDLAIVSVHGESFPGRQWSLYGLLVGFLKKNNLS